jgi:AraC-like DNA-binding protein
LNQPITATASSLLSGFIDSIEVKIKNAAYCEMPGPFYLAGGGQQGDIFLCLNKGNYFSPLHDAPLEEGSFYFIPGGQRENYWLSNVPGKFPQNMGPLASDPASLGRIINGSEAPDKERYVSYVEFDTLLYNAFPFFPLLDLPAFAIPPKNEFAEVLRAICDEKEQIRIGKNVMLKNYAHELVVRLFRFIDLQPALKKKVDKLHYLKDVRLIDIVKYIQDNLDKDLTNAAIAKVACVSDDYVGQFFKALTGRTLQDYIEHQRLERAMHLLKTIPKSVQDVAAMVGFKDAAYFSRRFRMRFAVNANTVRNGKNQDTW